MKEPHTRRHAHSGTPLTLTAFLTATLVGSALRAGPAPAPALPEVTVLQVRPGQRPDEVRPLGGTASPQAPAPLSPEIRRKLLGATGAKPGPPPTGTAAAPPQPPLNTVTLTPKRPATTDAFLVLKRPLSVRTREDFAVLGGEDSALEIVLRVEQGKRYLLDVRHRIPASSVAQDWHVEGAGWVQTVAVRPGREHALFAFRPAAAGWITLRVAPDRSGAVIHAVDITRMD